MIILQIGSLLLWLLVLPFLAGALVFPFLKKELRTPGVSLISGYVIGFTLLEIVGIPVVLLAVYHGFRIFKWIYAPLLLICAGGGVLVLRKGKREAGAESFFAGEPFRLRLKSMKTEERVIWILFFLVAAFQMYMAFTRASFDGDDAYYGVQALIAQQFDTLYRINPYTGRSSPVDVRHALALFPIWEAYIGSMSGIHATIICHSVIPLMLIPLTYVLYYQIGKSLLSKRKEQRPMFMLLLAVWQMFGNVSVYTPETFFLTRTWQGKSFAANFVIPAVIFLFLQLADSKDKKEQRGLWFLLGALNLAGGASSSLAILLSCLMTVGFGFLFALREKKFSILVRSGLTCMGGGVYVLLYLLLTHGIIVP